MPREIAARYLLTIKMINPTYISELLRPKGVLDFLRYRSYLWRGRAPRAFSGAAPMGDKVPASAFARFAPGESASIAPRFKLIGPIRLTIVGAVLLSIVVASSAGLFLSNLRNRILAENERNLSNSASILAKQIEHIFTAVESVQKSIIEQIAVFGDADSKNAQLQLSRHDVHLKLRDKAAGMPYVGSLTVIDTQGRLINFSRQWPIPDIDVTDRDFFKALQSDPHLTSFISEPVRNRATGTWVVHLARKISSANGEFLGLISVALELEYFHNYFGEVASDPNSGMALFRQDGVLLARFPRIDSEIGRRFPTAIALKLVSTANQGVGMSVGVIDGINRMVAAHRVGSHPIVVTTTKTVSAIFTNWRQTAAYVIGISTLSITIISAFAFLFIRMFRNYQALLKARAEQEKAEQFREQNLRFEAALDNMSQGLVMFDSSERIVVCNQRFIEMYGLSGDVVKPGCTLRELLRLRKEQGSFPEDIETYRKKLLTNLANGEATSIVVRTAAGHAHRVVSLPMAGGGWVATHEDTTEQVRAENLIEAQKLQLNAALENVSQGICMFDAAQRLIVCNKRYADLYGLNEEHTKPGTTLLAILRHRIANGNSPEDHEAYIQGRIDEVAASKPYQITNRLRDGRSVSVVHRPLADGGWVATHEEVTEAKRREESFRLLFEGNPVPMWVIDRESLRFLAVNEAAVTHYGYTREQFISMTVPDLRPVEDRERFAHFLRTQADDRLVEAHVQHVTAQGSTIDVCVYSRALTYENYNARLAAIHDITKTKLAENELRRTKKFLNTVIEHVPLPIMVKSVSKAATDARDCYFALVNRAAEEIMGMPRDQMIGKTTYQLYPKDRADHIVERDTEALRSDLAVNVYEHTLVTPRNGTRLVTARKVSIRDDDDNPQFLLTVLDDVTERRRAEERIAFLAHNDELTSLPNRAAFNNTFAQAINHAAKTGEPFAVLSIDLDRFKEINDVYGHTVGDLLLRETARRMQKVAGGAFLARLGGDEFTLIVTGDPQPAVADALANRLLRAFDGDLEIEEHRFKLGLSIGGAVYPVDGTDAKTLMINADAALYRAKAEARGSVMFFEAEMAARLRELRNLQNDLQSAADRGELLLHYQPQKQMAGKTIGFEALVRWQCPKRGLVPPGTFIPVAENSSLIVPIGEWILREACHDAASWPQPLNIAVNISPVQFHHSDLPRLVHSVLLETGLSPARLELEITEGVLIDDFSRAVSILNKLKSLGVQIALDDFGSGYSSLSYLHSFPFDKIKIDRSFVGDLEHNRHAVAIVRAVIGLGHSLNVPILAEGVETEAQHAFLVQEGCDEVQGYLTGRPRPIKDYAELVGRQTTARNNYASAVG